jgi:hypothetical protein
MKHIKEFKQFVNENYDSPTDREHNITNDELNRMVDLDTFGNKFEYGFYNGKNSADLNNLLNKVRFNEVDEYGLLEAIYGYLIKEVPFFKKFKINNSFEHKTFDLHLSYDTKIKKELDDDYSVKIDLNLTYHKNDDDIFDYKKDKFNIWLFQTIKPTRTSIDLSKEIPNFTNKDTGDLVDIIQKMGYGTPDTEDKYANEKYKLMLDNLTIEEFVKNIPKIKTKIAEFSKYVYSKYDIKL